MSLANGMVDQMTVVQPLNKTLMPYPGVTAIGGVATIYLTNDGTATGTALYSSIDTVVPYFVVADPTMAYAQPVVSGDLKTLTISCMRQTFTGIQVVGINVLGSVAVAAAPASVAIVANVQGKLV